ncbi:MAG: hypothetical protein HY736_15515 [Verrucomicrobia bacterium]|nr:hypothetical protein [Verrucomicrobiota bacterium]
MNDQWKSSTRALLRANARKPGSPVRLLGLLCLGLILTLATARAAPAPAAYRTDRILIRPKDTTLSSALTMRHAALGTRVHRAFPRLGGLQVVQLPLFLSVPQALASYRGSGLVAYAEPDYIVHPLLTPNDFRYWDGSLWGLHNTGLYGGVVGADVHAPQAWDTQCEAMNVIVAVVDTGVRCTHEDLAGNMWTNPGESGLDAFGLPKSVNLQDDDGDGFVDDVHGINAVPFGVSTQC